MHIDGTTLIFGCPHCEGPIIVDKKDIQCGIFRHAVYKRTGQPIPPHSDKATCDGLVERSEVYGCAKPFRIDTGNTVDTNVQYNVSVCDYI